MSDSTSERDDKVRDFLASVIELAERIQIQLSRHAEGRDQASAAFAEKRALFEHADPEVAEWFNSCELSAADSWQFYRQVLLALEVEQDKRKYQIANKPLEAGEEVHLEDNPFLIQEDDISNKEVVDDMIEHQQMARNDLMELMANMTADELAEFVRLAKGLASGQIWDHDYNL